MKPPDPVPQPSAHPKAGELDLAAEAAMLIDRLAQIIREMQDSLEKAAEIAATSIPWQGSQLDSTYPAEADRASVSAEVSARLTCREREVLNLLVMGMSNRQISRSLNISEPTVKNHLHAIYLKLDVTDRAQAISKVLRSS